MNKIDETIGARIARLRQARDWTQQTLADRAAVSRVAISHIEMNLSLPSERTITLISGLFKIDPRDLVAGTTYPKAKADRLPFVVCRHTALELQLALLERDLAWLRRLRSSPDWPDLAHELFESWSPQLDCLRHDAVDREQRLNIARAQRALLTTCRQSQSPVVADR